jgi:hypothetical protein
MPAADSAAGIARKWEGSVASGPSNQPYQTDLPLRVPDKHDVRFRHSGSKSKPRLIGITGKSGFYRTFANSIAALISFSIKKSRRDAEAQRWTQRKPGDLLLCVFLRVSASLRLPIYVFICAIKKIESGPKIKIGIQAISAGHKLTSSALGGLAAI